METVKGILELVESIRRDGIATCNIAEIETCGEAFDNLRGYVAGDGSNVYLHGQTRQSVPLLINHGLDVQN